MKQNAVRILAGVACLAVLGVALPAHAMMIAPAPIPERVAQADAVAVGTVGKVEPKNVSAPPLRGGGDKLEWQVVAFKVTDPITGTKEGKEIRVGFLPPPPPVPPAPNPGGGIVIGPRRRPGVTLSTGQDLCLFLVKHPTEDFYVPEMYFSVIDMKSPNAAKEVEAAKRCAKLLADPDAGLKAKDAEDRLLTATMLVSRYRSDPTGKGQTEPVDAEQSKLILAALSDSDWAAAQKNATLFGFSGNPQSTFLRLGLTEKDGWKQPMDFQTFPAVAKQWLKEHPDYRIQKFVEPRDK